MEPILDLTPEEAELIIAMWMGDVHGDEAVLDSLLQKCTEYVYATKGYRPYE